MRILLNMYPWYLPRRNREWRTHRDIAALSAVYPDLEFRFLSSVRAMALGNSVFLAQYAARRLGVTNVLLTRSFAFHALSTLNWLPRSFVTRTRPDVIFCHEYFPGNLSGAECPLVFETAYCSDDVLVHYRPGFSEEALLSHKRLSDRVMSHCLAACTVVNVREPSGAARLKAAFPVHADKVRAVPPYLTYIEPIEHSALQHKHDSDGVVRVLFVGNFARRKGLPQLLDAVRALPADIRRAMTLTIVSQFLDGRVEIGPHEATVIDGGKLSIGELTGEPDRQGPLTFAAVLALMQQSHIVALPTLADTFGFVYLEAMANGCAVIGSNRDPQDWILDYGKAGLLADPTDPREIGRALMALITNRNLRSSIADAGLKRFSSRYYHRIVGAEYVELFNEAIEKWRRTYVK